MAGRIGSGPSARGGGPVAGAVSGRGLRRPKPRSFQADTAPRAGPFNLNNRKPRKGAVSRCAGCGPAALTSTTSPIKKGREGHTSRSALSFLSPKKGPEETRGTTGRKQFHRSLVYIWSISVVYGTGKEKQAKRSKLLTCYFAWSGQRDSNPRVSAWEADALPLGDARLCVG